MYSIKSLNLLALCSYKRVEITPPEKFFYLLLLTDKSRIFFDMTKCFLRFFFEDHKTTRPQDYKTTRLQDKRLKAKDKSLKDLYCIQKTLRLCVSASLRLCVSASLRQLGVRNWFKVHLSFLRENPRY